METPLKFKKYHRGFISVEIRSTTEHHQLNYVRNITTYECPSDNFFTITINFINEKLEALIFHYKKSEKQGFKKDLGILFDSIKGMLIIFAV